MMDTSEQYIKMCEKAGEIQEKATYPLGAFYHENDLVICNMGDYYHQTKGSNIPGYIWLPQQDQLQEMLGNVDESYRVFRKWLDTSWVKKILVSWEQLWLAFVMKEKFGKVWDGEDWIKE